MEPGMKQKSQMWGAVCGKTARTVLRGVYLQLFKRLKKEVNLLMVRQFGAVDLVR